jgi:hypothetical protein
VPIVYLDFCLRNNNTSLPNLIFDPQRSRVLVKCVIERPRVLVETERIVLESQVREDDQKDSIFK